MEDHMTSSLIKKTKWHSDKNEAIFAESRGPFFKKLMLHINESSSWSKS